MFYAKSKLFFILFIPILLGSCGGGGSSGGGSAGSSTSYVASDFETSEYNEQYGLASISASTAYADGYSGSDVTVAVIDSGVKKTGVTIHYVNSNYDQGQIIVQKTINVLAQDTHITLAKKVLSIEHQLYPFVLKAICEDRIDWINGKPWIIAAN